MSSEPLHIRARSASLGKEVLPSPEPQPSPAPAPAAPTFKQQRELPPSTRPNLAPAFRAVSAGLTRDLAAADAIRLHDVRDLLPGMAEANPRETLSKLARGVASKEISNQEAAQLFETLHPGVRPEDV
jgi:hypothetical protein